MSNVVRDDLAERHGDALAIVTLASDGRREEWTFGELLDAAGRFAGALVAHGVGRGDVVLTLVGNRIEYPVTMLACLHIGAVMLPCSEQLRAKDIALRLARAAPALVVCDERNRPTLDKALGSVPVVVLTVPATHGGEPPPYAEMTPSDASFVLFTSGTSGEPKLVRHGQAYVTGQHVQALNWLGAEPGELVWSTAAPGWSKSTRNGFLAPWLCGAVALLEDRRFDAVSRLATIREENVQVLCMAPTEYRLIAAHGPITGVGSLRRLVTAGEALGVPAVTAWHAQTGLTIADGYGQTETGHLAGVRPGETAPPGSMAGPCPASRWSWSTASCVSTRRASRPSSSGTGADPRRPACGTPATGCAATGTGGCSSSRAPTTSSSAPGTGSGPRRSSRPCWVTRRCVSRPSSGSPTRRGARSSWPSSSCATVWSAPRSWCVRCRIT